MCKRDKLDFLFGFFKNLSFKIMISGQVGRRTGEWSGIGHPPSFTIWLTFLKNLSIMLLDAFLYNFKQRTFSTNK